MLTMLIGGLWHGASWNFNIWGGLNGLGIVVFKLWNKISLCLTNLSGGIELGGLFNFQFCFIHKNLFRSGSINSWEEMDKSHNILSEWFANEMLYQLMFDLNILN